MLIAKTNIIKNKSLLFNIGLAILGIFFAFCVVEILLRIIPYQPKYSIPPYLFTNHPINGFTLRPGYSGEQETLDGITTYEINQQGIRSPIDYKVNNPQSKKDSIDIFIIGDSFTFGWGINEDNTFPRLLEKSLTSQGYNYNVINLGVPGYGTTQSFNRLLEYSIRLKKPDIVIYMFSPNDPIDNISSKHIIVNGIKINERRSKYKYLAFFINKLYLHSKTVALIIDIYNTTLNPTILATKEMESLPLGNRPDIDSLKSEIEKLVTWTEKQQIKLLVMATHDSEYNPILRNILDSLGISMLESPHYFIESGLKPEDIYLKYDGHWNEKANQVVAKAIMEFLESNHWLEIQP